MIINVHAHLDRKELYSDKYWAHVADGLAKRLGLSKEITMEKIVKPFSTSKNYHAEGFVEVLDKLGVDKAIITAMDFGLSIAGEPKWSIEEINHWIASQAEEYSDKLVALCAVDPRRGERAIKLIEKAVLEWGMKGVKMHPTAGFYPDNPGFFPFYEKCVELDVPLHSHAAALTSPLVESKYANPIYLDSVAVNFPELKIIIIHFGGLSWTKNCTEIMCSRPNIYTEISTHQINALTMPQQWLIHLRGFLDTPPMFGEPLSDRIMFGSDWPYLEYAMKDDVWIDWIKNIPEEGKKYGLKFEEREIGKILGVNAKKILKL
nr:amidohydrolase family protein [Candidatus Freyarchaeota archaeon]